MPDNSNLQCNLCVTGLDESITSEDLHLMFQQFGELKSCKVSQDPKTGKSKCYGYVWFTTEKACAKALEASSYLPYSVKLFKSFCLRACEPQSTSNKCSVSITGYPASFTEKDLTELIGADKIKKINFTTKKAEVTFKSAKWAQSVLIIDGVLISGNKLLVKHIGEDQTEAQGKTESVGLTNLYVKDLSKEATSEIVRRAFARYGKISGFSLVNKEQFTTNIAFISYASAEKAKHAFENVVTDFVEFGKFEVFWHKPKASLKQELIEDINC